MKLSVKNLGPIKEGDIVLNKQLIILTGPNNTGKSYLTYLIHGLSKYEVLNGLSPSIKSFSPIFRGEENLIQAISQGELITNDSILKSKIYEISQAFTEIIKSNFIKIFASSNIRPEIFIDLEYFRNYSKLALYESIQVMEDEMYGTPWGRDREKMDLKSANPTRFPDINDRVAHYFGLITTVILDHFLVPESYFFPAERTAINLFAKHITSTKAEIKDELDSEVIIGMSDEELGRRLRAQVQTAPKYPYAIRDYINFVNEFKREEIEGPFASIATKIELTLIGGKVNLDEFGQLSFNPQNSESALELHLSSSLVKSLSYLILYLRYTAQRSHQVIIDEPELNLHPDLQVALARVIVEMVNAGLKVIISTHSDYFIKELNNLVLLHDLNETEEGQAFIQEKGYTTAQLLDKKQISAYYLNNNAITAINIEEDGIAVPSINDTINAIDSLTQEILYQL